MLFKSLRDLIKATALLTYSEQVTGILERNTYASSVISGVIAQSSTV